MTRVFVSTLFLLGVFLATPLSTYALEVSGWVPYWSGSKGTIDARKHMEALSVLHPFAFTVTSGGKLKDLAGLTKSTWKNMMSDAHAENVLVVPTVMTSNTDAIHTILSDEKLRTAHIKNITAMVKKGKYDGVDIDYEGKRASTRPHFSTFLQELNEALGDKMLSCTIEARTPPKDLYRTIPADIQYSNDLEEINEHCDRVNVMVYDQQRAILSLNDKRKGEPYIPVSDSAWAELVIEHMKKTIDAEKLHLGVATYGAEWELTVEPEWYKEYKKLWALNPSYAVSEAKNQKVSAGRNSAGELSYTYLPKSSKETVGTYKVPINTKKGNEAAAKALAYANDTGKTTIVHVVWWSDAQAVAEKVALARELGIAGVAIFKIDGGEDKDIWKLF
jgi:spore germination protein YaaH